MRIAVTGSSGKLGRATVQRLTEQGHAVVGLDVAGAPGPSFTRVELSDYGQTLDALLGVTARHEGVDAVVHLAAIPVNGLVPDAATFHNNVTVSFNVLHGAIRAGIRTIVHASSIAALGFPFDAPPSYLPLDESLTSARNTYGLGKVAEEAMAAQLAQWHEGTSITALRFTNVVEPGDYARFGEHAGDPAYRRDLMWSYVDVRDGALAVDLALSRARPGFAVYNVAASDSAMTIPSARLAAEERPGVPLLTELGEFETLMSIDRARAELGFEPQHLWRDELAIEQAAAEPGR